MMQMIFLLILPGFLEGLCISIFNPEEIFENEEMSFQSEEEEKMYKNIYPKMFLVIRIIFPFLCILRFWYFLAFRTYNAVITTINYTLNTFIQMMYLFIDIIDELINPDEL